MKTCDGDVRGHSSGGGCPISQVQCYQFYDGVGGYQISRKKVLGNT